MVTKDYDYVTYDERLFQLQFETPLEGLPPQRQFEHTVDTVATVLDVFEHVVRPTTVELQMSGEDADVYAEILTDAENLSNGAIIDTLREMSEQVQDPVFPSFSVDASVRVTLSDGVQYLGGNDNLSEVERRANPSSDISTPLEISVGHRDRLMPCLTEIITVEGDSDHWLNGDIEQFYLPEATPLAKLDQSRLAAALSSLYDTVDPVEIVFDTFENTEGWHTPKQTVPAYQSLQTRHAVEWVLENFEQRRPDQQSLELEYTSDEIHPLITHTQGRSPDEKVHAFLRAAIPDDRYGDGATVTVNYPTETTVFVNESGKRWLLETESDL